MRCVGAQLMTCAPALTHALPMMTPCDALIAAFRRSEVLVAVQCSVVRRRPQVPFRLRRAICHYITLSRSPYRWLVLAVAPSRSETYAPMTWLCLKVVCSVAPCRGASREIPYIAFCRVACAATGFARALQSRVYSVRAREWDLVRGGGPYIVRSFGIFCDALTVTPGVARLA